MSAGAKLSRLAALAGVASSYRDAHGEQTATKEDGLRAVLSQLGYAAETGSEIDVSLARAEDEARRLLPPAIAATAGSALEILAEAGAATEWRLTLENGTAHEGRAGGGARPGLLLDALPEGYHKLELSAGSRTAGAVVIAAPQRCHIPNAFLDGGRGFGLTAQVYGLRSSHNFGIGDFTDVARLAAGAARSGAAFLGLSPVNVLFPEDRSNISPYSPSSRLFIDPIYIDPRHTPEFATGPVARYLNEDAMAARLESLREAQLVDYEQSWALKRELLGKLWQSFVDSEDQAFADFRLAGGEMLERYATFEALSERFAREGRFGLTQWPVPFQDAGSATVTQFREAHPEVIAFHAWLQWVADEQLAAAQKAACNAGMQIGLYRDLAVGTSAGGAEAWARPDWFLKGLSTGAPPDLLGPLGQNWGLLPFDPKALDAQGLVAFRSLLAANMRHAGAIRIDHAFQLQRLYLIPQGMPATHGAYVSYPFAAMLAAVKLESKRASALVVAEDLGTGPDGFSEAIIEAGLVSSRILSFERGKDGSFHPPGSYPRNVMAAVATHDLPTFKGWWTGADTGARERYELYTPDQAAAEREARIEDRKSLMAALTKERIVTSPAVPSEPPVEAASRFLARSPAMLVALQLEDILGELEQANVPGAHVSGAGDEAPNWRRKLSRDVDAILAPEGPLIAGTMPMLDEGRTAGAAPVRTAPPAPHATYRLQFHKGFPFADATKILPYLKRLGVSHVYASPILKARPGSTHGYDTVDPQAINPELGGPEAFDRFSEAVKAEGLLLLLDIVPNHMGVGGSDNKWWLSVLEWGQVSPFAETFDIDWERLGAHGKMVAPFLGSPYGAALEQGDLKLAFDAGEGSFSIWHFEHRFPICPLSYPGILDRAIAADGGDGAGGLLRISEELRALAQEPEAHRGDMPAACEKIKKRIATLARRRGAARALEQAVTVVNGTIGVPESFGAIHRLLEQQAYRLAFWRVAASDINYRRFFDIDGLAGVRIEKPAVFERTHQLIFDLVRRGQVHGLRIDHIDGLADPAAYAEALQRELGPGFYIVAEKILEPGEELRAWPIAGTTGYEMLNIIDGVFADTRFEAAFDEIYDGVTGTPHDYESALQAAKSQVLLESFSSELESLVSDMKRIADSNRMTRDYSVNSIRSALADVIMAFPVYRTYVTPGFLAAEDRTLIENVLKDAKRASSLPDRSVHDFIGSVLLGTLAAGAPGQAPPALVNRFRRRFQQLTGPVMAKSLEDTLFYRYVRFLALNEVGGEPKRFGVPPEEFHAINAARAKNWPRALTATATHDTKRGEDARARLLGLSEVPDLWRDILAVWQDEAGPIAEPDANDQYMLLQTVVAAWPLELLQGAGRAEIESFRDRLVAYIPKAFREGKRHSKWIEPNEAYEGAAKDLIARLLSNGSNFTARMMPLVSQVAERGMMISLGRTILKCTIPGVPDFYQGTALWDFSLVDPDNRRPVDYGERWELAGKGRSAAQLLGSWMDGAIKLHIVAQLLADRGAYPSFYAKASYQPATVSGPEAARVLAFTREHRDDILFVAVPRLQGRPASGTGPARAKWDASAAEIPPGSWLDLLSGRSIEASGPVPLAELFQDIPFAVLRKQK